jgi:Tfp pilus assembly protein PilO
VTFTLKRIGGVTAAAAIVLIAVWYLSLLRPQQHKLAAANRQYAAAAKSASQLQQQVTSLQALERRVPADTARLKSLDAALPHTEDLQEVFTQLDQAATTSGVHLTAVSPSAPTSVSASSSSAAGSSSAGSSSAGSVASAVSGTQQVGVTVTLTGTYSATMTFMNDLDHMSRVVVIDGASFSPAPGGSIGTTLTTRIFYAG